MESQQNEGREREESLGAPRCPDCDRVMSRREAAEQGSCNDCYGNAGYPSPFAPHESYPGGRTLWE